jgi:hypothetical protein
MDEIDMLDQYLPVDSTPIHTSELYPKQRVKRILGLSQTLQHDEFFEFLGSVEPKVRSSPPKTIIANNPKPRVTSFIDDIAAGDKLKSYRLHRHLSELKPVARAVTVVRQETQHSGTLPKQAFGPKLLKSCLSRAANKWISLERVNTM